MQIIDVEQGSQEWLEARKGVITGTRLKSVMSKKSDTRKGLIYELIAEMIAPTPEGYKSTAMERGNIIEEIVNMEYPDFEKVGFVKKYDWLGISPDGLRKGEDGKYIKSREIKSPEPKAFVRYKIEGGIPDEYKWQVIHYYVVIDEMQELDFIIYNPTIYDPEYRKIVVKTKREHFKIEIAEAKDALSSFRSEWLETLKKFIAK